MKGRGNPIANLIVLGSAMLAFVVWLAAGPLVAVPIFVFGLYGSLSPRQLKEWERGVLLRLGRFQRVLGPGINWTYPGFDRLVATVDMRIRSTPFQAEKTLTKDTVPVNVDAVLFWVVTDARKAIVDVEHFAATVSWAAQTTLRECRATWSARWVVSPPSRQRRSNHRLSARPTPRRRALMSDEHPVPVWPRQPEVARVAPIRVRGSTA